MFGFLRVGAKSFMGHCGCFPIAATSDGCWGWFYPSSGIRSFHSTCVHEIVLALFLNLKCGEARSLAQSTKWSRKVLLLLKGHSFPGISAVALLGLVVRRSWFPSLSSEVLGVQIDIRTFFYFCLWVKGGFNSCKEIFDYTHFSSMA
jgi:hypothetical protein